MSKFYPVCKARPLWLTALLLTLPTAALQMPSNADTVGTPQTIDFAPIAVGDECTFSSVVAGALAINPDKTLIGTEQQGGTRTSVNVLANFPNAKVVLNSLIATKDTNPFTPISSTVYLAKTGDSSSSALGATNLDITNSVLETIDAGVDFGSEEGTPFDAGDYDARLTLTCTTGGIL